MVDVQVNVRVQLSGSKQTLIDQDIPFSSVKSVTNLIGSGRADSPTSRDIKIIAKKLRAEFSYIEDKSMVLESEQPQVGKSRLECCLLWLNHFVDKQLVIFILDDKLNSLQQFMLRDFPKFNEELGRLKIDNVASYHLRPKELKSSTPLSVIKSWFDNKDVIVTTLNHRRLQKLVEALTRHKVNKKKVTLVYDEADMRFADLDPDTTVLKEKYASDIEKGVGKVYYITATAFACINSPKASSCKYHPIKPRDIQGCEYRSYHTFNKNFIATEKIRKWLRDDGDDQVFRDYIHDVSDHKVRLGQPPIVLINVSCLTEDHNKMAQTIIDENASATVLVYNNKGIVTHKSKGSGEKTDREEKSVLTIVDKTSYRKVKARTIAEGLQYLKDQGHSHKHPIFIVAGKRASRAETFKSLDQKWILTRMLLALSDQPSMEVAIQSLRACGIYKVDSPIATIDISLDDHQIVSRCVENKKAIANGLANKTKLRKSITKIPLYRIAGGFTRPDCEDGSIIDDDVSCAYETTSKKDMKKHIQTVYPDREALWLTRSSNIIVKQKEFPFMTMWKENNDLSALGTAKARKHQTVLQKFLKKRLGKTQTTLQICYSQQRERELNVNPLRRDKRKYAEYIAMTMKEVPKDETFEIPVIRYLYELEDIEECLDRVYVWGTTGGTYRCAVTKHDKICKGTYNRIDSKSS